jgi:hypothetical protein
VVVVAAGSAAGAADRHDQTQTKEGRRNAGLLLFVFGFVFGWMRYLRSSRAIRLDVSHRLPPIACTSE